MQLIDKDGNLSPVIKILTDYPRDDLAHDEVHQSLVTACIMQGVKPFNLDVGAIPGLDTVTAGFKSAQLVMNSKLGFGHVFHTNCAPRKNLVSVKSQGEKIVLGMTRTGAAWLAVNSGYTLAPFHAAAQAGDVTFFQTSVPDAGSQFRSRDFFPDALATLAAHLTARAKELGAKGVEKLLDAGDYEGILKGLPFIGAPLEPANMAQLPEGAVFYIDNFGNMKLNIKHHKLRSLYDTGTVLVVAGGETVSEVTVGDTGFSQGEGVMAVTSGSSGWAVEGEGKTMFSEIFMRGGRAESHFPGIKPGDALLGLPRAMLSQVVETLQGADAGVQEKLGLYNMREARIIRLLGREKLITGGFDTCELADALEEGALLSRLLD
ncbi:MAG: hypothetical protein GC185_12835 [Alphaproteobacteria bacterium]|nr:hypothetical protein [Alphaproteobacteria bacterium]